jgi:hypothetical protein
MAMSREYRTWEKPGRRDEGVKCHRGSFDAVALYPDRNELKSEYPELEDEDVAQALEFAALNLDDQVLPLEAA